KRAFGSARPQFRKAGPGSPGEKRARSPAALSFSFNAIVENQNKSSASPNLSAVREYLSGLQDTLCDAIQKDEGAARVQMDKWTRAEGGGGRTRVLANGALFEKAGVAFSPVQGRKLPPSATAHRPELAGKAWEALGVSVVLHPQNPYVPSAHLNVRFFI